MLQFCLQVINPCHHINMFHDIMFCYAHKFAIFNKLLHDQLCANRFHDYHPCLQLSFDQSHHKVQPVLLLYSIPSIWYSML